MSKENPQIPEQNIEFTGEACCALREGILNNIETVHALEEILGKDNVALFATILVNTNYIHFKLDEPKAIFYGQVAKEELKRLKSLPDSLLVCSHASSTHIKELEKLVAKLVKES